MARRFLLLVLLLSFPVSAQAQSESLLQRLLAVDEAETSVSDCDEQVALADNLNGPDLFYAAIVCKAADQKPQSSFLLAAGQTRSMADLAHQFPASKADHDKTMELYELIYFHAGGLGDEEVLRNDDMRKQFFSLYDGWSPRLEPDYDPGWVANARPNEATYLSTIREAHAHRRGTLEEFATLYSDETYYSLHLEMQEFQRSSSGVYEEGSEELELLRELQSKIKNRAIDLGFQRPDLAPPSTEERDVENASHSPLPTETAYDGSDEAMVQSCNAYAERLAISNDGELDRVLVTFSEEHGTIWRADVSKPGGEVRRFTCTTSAFSIRPLDLGEDKIAPLPSAP